MTLVLIFFERFKKPEIKLDIYRTSNSTWRFFRKYHYLSSSLLSNSECFVGLINNKLVCFAAITDLIHNVLKNVKRVHRLVVLPDYQGVGIGKSFITCIARLYLKKSFRFRIITSNPALIHSFQKDKRWILVENTLSRPHHDKLKRTNSFSTRHIFSYEFVE